MVGNRCLRDCGGLVLGAFCLVFLAGCAASLFSIRDKDMPGPTIRLPAIEGGVVDRREAFAPYFCHSLSEHGIPANAANSCRAWLRLPEPGGPSTAVTPAKAAAPRRRNIVIVPGILGECVARSVTPFSDAYPLLREQGHRINVIGVEGRSSSARNGRIIDAWMTARADELEDVIVIAYSKGTTDFMHAALLDGEKRHWLDRIAALVTVSGVVNGTPLAARGEKLYGRLLANIPAPACGVGDRGGVESLTYRQALATRADYLSIEHPYRTYAVVAITDSASVNPVLAPFHRQLSRLDGRHDGQVLSEDAMLPGSQLVASASADHWSIALPFETGGKEVRLLSRNNHFPRLPFALALVDFIDSANSEAAP